MPLRNDPLGTAMAILLLVGFGGVSMLVLGALMRKLWEQWLEHPTDDPHDLSDTNTQ
jgi:hypothetical protein